MIILNFIIILNSKINNKNLEEYQKKWINGQISNLEYIMWLNFFSNRALRDITQYPIFPWILQKY